MLKKHKSKLIVIILAIVGVLLILLSKYDKIIKKQRLKKWK